MKSVEYSGSGLIPAVSMPGSKSLFKAASVFGGNMENRRQYAALILLLLLSVAFAQDAKACFGRCGGRPGLLGRIFGRGRGGGGGACSGGRCGSAGGGFPTGGGMGAGVGGFEDPAAGAEPGTENFDPNTGAGAFNAGPMPGPPGMMPGMGPGMMPGMGPGPGSCSGGMCNPGFGPGGPPPGGMAQGMGQGQVTNQGFMPGPGQGMPGSQTGSMTVTGSGSGEFMVNGHRVRCPPGMVYDGRGHCIPGRGPSAGNGNVGVEAPPTNPPPATGSAAGGGLQVTPDSFALLSTTPVDQKLGPHLRLWSREEMLNINGTQQRANVAYFIEIDDRHQEKILRLNPQGIPFDFREPMAVVEARNYLTAHRAEFASVASVQSFLNATNPQPLTKDLYNVAGMLTTMDAAGNSVVMKFDPAHEHVLPAPGQNPPRVSNQELENQARDHYDRALKAKKVDRAVVNDLLAYLYPHLRLSDLPNPSSLVEYSGGKENPALAINPDGKIVGTTHPETIDQMLRFLKGSEAVKDNHKGLAALAMRKYGNYDPKNWEVPGNGRYKNLRFTGDSVFEYGPDKVLREIRFGDSGSDLGKIHWNKYPDTLKQLVWLYRWALRTHQYDPKPSDSKELKAAKLAAKKVAENIRDAYQDEVPPESKLVVDEDSQDDEEAPPAHSIKDQDQGDATPPETMKHEPTEPVVSKTKRRTPLPKAKLTSTSIRNRGQDVSEETSPLRPPPKINRDHSKPDEVPPPPRPVGKAKENRRREIVPGTDSWPGVGLLIFQDDKGKIWGTCSGALLTTGTFATTERCFNDLPRNVRMTEIKFKNNDGKVVSVPLPDPKAFSYDGVGNDIAYVHLPKKFFGIPSVLHVPFSMARKEDANLPMDIQIIGMQKDGSLTKVVSEGCKITEHRITRTQAVDGPTELTNCNSWGQGGLVIGQTRDGRKLLLGLVTDATKSANQQPSDGIGRFYSQTAFTPFWNRRAYQDLIPEREAVAGR